MRILLIFVVLFFYQCVGSESSALGDDDVVAWVDDEPVTAEEFSFFANRNKYKIMTLFKNEHKLKYHADFWHDRTVGKTPLDVLKGETLDSIVKIKVQLILAKEYGIVKDISFQAIQIYLENENLRRQEALKNNIVIYGPQQYTMDNFYDYFTSNLIIKLKDYLLRNNLIKVDVNLGITKSDKNNLINEDNKAYSNAYIMSAQINQQYNDMLTAMIEKAKIEINNTQMKKFELRL